MRPPPAFDEAALAQALAEYGDKMRRILRRPGAHEPDYRHRRLLRARRERPRHRRAAEKSDELAAFHSITSSAATSRVCGTVMPSAVAVLRLMTNSNLTDCTTGKSVGFSP